jgi:hypothetical protein
MNEYPVKEIIISRIQNITIIVRAESDEEANRIAIEYAKNNLLNEEKFKDIEVNFESEIWESYKEDIINESVIINGKKD